jgi:hypothetical protein
MRHWTLEERLKQSKAIRRWKPWEYSIGAKTPQGKAISSRNATKTGDSVYVREFIKLMNRILKEQKDLMDSKILTQ